MLKPKTEALVFWGLQVLQGGFLGLNLWFARFGRFPRYSTVSAVFIAACMVFQFLFRRKCARLKQRMLAATQEREQIQAELAHRAEIAQMALGESDESEARAKVYLERVVALTGAVLCGCGCGGYVLGKVYVPRHGQGATILETSLSTCICFSEPIPISERVASILLILHNQPEEFDRWHAEMLGDLPRFSATGPN